MSKDVEILRAACCIAGLDGEICDRERPLLDRLAEKAGVGSASFQAMIDRAESDQSFYEEQFHVVKMDAEETMKILFAVAVADGVLLRAERIILQHFADKLGLPEHRFDELLLAAERHATAESET